MSSIMSDDIEQQLISDTTPGADIKRSRSLVRPERQRIGPDHPQFYYQQVASQQSGRVRIQSSNTGNDPFISKSASVPSRSGSKREHLHDILTDIHGGGKKNKDLHEVEETDGRSQKNIDEQSNVESNEVKVEGGEDGEGPDGLEDSGWYSASERELDGSEGSEVSVPGIDEGTQLNAPEDISTTSLHRAPQRPQGFTSYLNQPDFTPLENQEKSSESKECIETNPAFSRRKPYMPKEGGVSLWNWYCRLLTFPVLPAMMRPFGMKTPERQMAWREKIGLISCVLMLGAFVGYLTFGFTQSVCSNNDIRIHAGNVPNDNMIIFGNVYNFGSYEHPGVLGIEDNSPILYPPVNAGGKDASFLFQNVNGHCKGLIKPRDNATIPTRGDEMAWYFPCNAIDTNNNSLVSHKSMLQNSSIELYDGWGCHTSQKGRQELYKNANKTAIVYFTWDDLNKSESNLVVYNGDVLNLNYLDHILVDQLTYPDIFDTLRNDSFRGHDISQNFSYGQGRQSMMCLRELTKVGEIDTDSIGCLASSVVLYMSLVFIVGLVAAKFILACYFRFFIARKQGASEVSPSAFNEHDGHIEDWSNGNYNPSAFSGRPQPNKRNSVILEKLTTPYIDPNRTSGITMSTQNPSMSRSRVAPGGSIHNVPLVRKSIYGSKATLINDIDKSNTTTENDNSQCEAVSLQDFTPPPTLAMTSNNYQVLNSPTSSRQELGTTEGEVSGPAGSFSDYLVPQPPLDFQPRGFPLAHAICMVTAYSESVEGLRTTLDSICTTEYPNSHKLIVIVCDGIIKGSGNSMSTPEICLSMIHDFSEPPEDVKPYSYVSVVTGTKRHNMAKVYAGFYKYDNDTVDARLQQRVPIVLIVKCGTPAEAMAAKPGNRGKRDSQIILMNFLQRVMFDERMTELDFEIFNGIRSVTGIAPDFYEMLLMVDADTKVYPDSLTHMIAEMVKDPEIMGICGETKIANKMQSWVTKIQVFEYFISHHQAKAFESVFGGVTCLPGCFSMYRIKSPKGAQGYWVPILCNPDIVERYSDNVVDTLHKKNLLLLGEDRFLSTLMLKTFPKRKMVFVPKAACKTVVPDEFKVLLSQRRRWINSTIHNLMELVLVRDLCGVFLVSMQFVVFVDLVSTSVLPAAITFTLYVVIIAIVSTPTPTMSLILLALILGLPGVLIIVTATRASYIVWMLIYLLALPIWNFVLPMYSYWKFDDFSWGDTRKLEGGDKGGHDEAKGEFDWSQIVMKRWREFQHDRELEAWRH